MYYARYRKIVFADLKANISLSASTGGVSSKKRKNTLDNDFMGNGTKRPRSSLVSRFFLFLFDDVLMQIATNNKFF